MIKDTPEEAPLLAASEAVPANYGPLERPTSVRYGMLTLLALAAVTAYLTRVSVAPAKSTIQAQFHLSNSQMGQIMAIFFLGYLWFQIPTGLLGARFGGRKALFGLGVFAAACAAWTGLATGPISLLASRFGLGLAQAGLVPCASRSVLDWFPVVNRGTAGSVMASSMLVGAVLASGLTSMLLPSLGWRTVFLVYAGVTLLWSIGYYAAFRDTPEQHAGVNSAELDLIRGTTTPRGAARPVVPPKATPGTRAERFRATLALLGVMVCSSSAWMICAQALFRAFGAAFFITWFPAFLEQAYKVKLQDTGIMAMLPLIAGVVGPLAGGPIVDLLLKRTGNRWLSRSVTGGGALFLCAICTFAATLVADPMAVVLILSLGNFCFTMGSPSTWAACMDIGGEHTQFVSGLQNMAGNAGAMWCATAVGSLFDHILRSHASWNLVLYLFVAIHIAGGISWLCLNPNRSAVKPAGA